LNKILSTLLYQRKQAKLQWLQDPSEINGDNLNNTGHEASRYFRKRRQDYLKDKFNELTTNKNKNIRDLYKEINTFKRVYQTTSNLVMNDNVQRFAYSHNILYRQKNYIKI
jgi:hypothetical protein